MNYPIITHTNKENDMIKLRGNMLALMLCCGLMLAAPGWAQSLNDKVIEHHLSNGMTLLMYERHQAPIIACHLYVNAGSANDAPGQTGIAHITEHIAFKGTKTLGTTDYAAEKQQLDRLDALWQQIVAEQEKGEQADQAVLKTLQEAFTQAEAEAGKYVISEAYSQIMEENGGVDLNATTSSDATEYFVSLPANRLELWMKLEADRLMNTVPREFYKERSVVMEERRMRTDDYAVGMLFEQFLAAAYIAHPYGIPGIGWASDIAQITPQQLMQFYATYYTPSNMTVAVVGDIQPNDVIRLAEQYFGQIPARQAAPKIRTIEPKQVGERRVYVPQDSNPYVLIGYHRPDVRDKDDLVFDVISFLLSNGMTSRFYQELVEKQQLAVDVNAIASFPGQKYPSLFVIFGVPLEPHTPQELETAIYAELEKLKTQPVDAHALQKVINNVEAGFIASLSSNSGLAEQLAFAQNVMGDWRAAERQLERVKTITADDVMRVAQTYFTEENRTVAWLIKQQ